eukprot:3049387-Pleurochrysis_carterae.AAC.2
MVLKASRRVTRLVAIGTGIDDSVRSGAARDTHTQVRMNSSRRCSDRIATRSRCHSSKRGRSTWLTVVSRPTMQWLQMYRITCPASSSHKARRTRLTSSASEGGGGGTWMGSGGQE